MGTQPQPDDVVLMDAKSTLEMLVHKMLELQRRVAELEAVKLTQQPLIDSHEARIAYLERLLKGQGDA